jgi:acetyl-CoA synthetase
MEQASTDFKIPETNLKMLLYSILPVELPECQRRFTCASCCFTHYVTGKYVLDFHEGDRFWCTADPGWVTASYGIIAPLVSGVTSIIDEAV